MSDYEVTFDKDSFYLKSSLEPIENGQGLFDYELYKLPSFAGVKWRVVCCRPWVLYMQSILFVYAFCICIYNICCE